MDWYTNKDKDNNKVDQVNAIIEPTTVEEAYDSEYKEQWNKEYKSLIDNQTWTLCKGEKQSNANGFLKLERIKMVMSTDSKLDLLPKVIHINSASIMTKFSLQS